jgi:hypothetical protein
VVSTRYNLQQPKLNTTPYHQPQIEKKNQEKSINISSLYKREKKAQKIPRKGIQSRKTGNSVKNHHITKLQTNITKQRTFEEVYRKSL